LNGGRQDEWGFSATPAETVAIWESIARRWASRPSPWRPSRGDIALYRELAGRRLSGRVLILGTTAELRDLVAEACTAPVYADLSAAMRDVTTPMLRRADPAAETWIEGDWCEAPIPRGEFDLALGDMIWWVNSVQKQYPLRDAIHGFLKPDGLFVGRFRFTDPGRADEDPVSAVLARLNGDPRQAEGSIMSWLYDHTADHELRRLNPAAAGELAFRLADRPELAAHAEFLREVSSRRIGAAWTSQSREELLAIVRERFDVVAEARADDYESELYPILALRPA
jgi:SAM-dependent methyltransferase